MMDPYTAHRRRHRIATKLKNKINKMVSQLPECEFALVYSSLSETKSVLKREWNVIGNNQAVVESIQDSIGVLKKARDMDLGASSATKQKPRNSVVRASMARSMLKAAWLKHVKGTEYEGQTQMYKLVRSGKVPPLPWWNKVVGQGVPFDNTALNVADHSSKVFDFLSSMT